MAHVVSPATHPWLRLWIARGQQFIQPLVFDRHLRSFRASLPEAPSDELIDNLFAAWGDRLSSERRDYIQRCLAEATRASGPILQCGSGLLSVLIGLVCQHANAPGKRLWVLEHDPHWGNLARSWLEARDIKHAHIIYAPAEQFNGFLWYVLDPSRLPNDFALVLSEASAALPGSARGVVSRMAKQFGNRCVILAGNARRPKDLKFLADWAKSQGAPFVMQEGEHPYLKIALRDRRPESAHEEGRLNTAFGPTRA